MSDENAPKDLTDDQRIEELRRKYRANLLAIPAVSIQDFFEVAPPDKQYRLSDFEWATTTQIKLPAIHLYCENKSCTGERIFRPTSGSPSIEIAYIFATYKCANCGEQKKVFSLTWFKANIIEDGVFLLATKLGESPAFGPQIPSKVIALIGPDRESFLQGTRSESRGLGIGAFAYYRRVVENQRSRIISEIAKVSRLKDASPETEQMYVAAMKEGRFQQSIELVKDALPPVLFINGNNPLTLLHSALSSGLHDADMSDEHCLALAQSIRVVLTELAERIAIALKDNRDLSSAVNTLLAQKRKLGAVSKHQG